MNYLPKNLIQFHFVNLIS